jgi:dTDP-4-amino-4,6-dideoxygalactose transaminase
MKVIPYGRQYIDKKDESIVSKALKEDLITTGNYVKKFEKKISNFLKVKYSFSCINGTAAIHLAFRAIDLKKNDIIIMPAINFIAAYSMAKACDAKIFLADVDPLTGQMTPETLLKCIKSNKLKKIKAIITMYLGGYPENVFEFYTIKKKFNCYLIEDACHALGSKYNFKNKKTHIGSCKHSDMATFSLHPVKTITSGEGGVITTNNKNLANKILLFRSHGIKRHKLNHWQYDIQESGFNYRLSDINCALALSQLNKIKKFIYFRDKVYKFYNAKFNKLNNLISFNKYNKKNSPSYHLYLLSINFKKIKSIKKNLFKFLKKKKILAQYHYIPIYKFKFYSKKIRLSEYRGSQYYFKNTLSLPIFYNMKFSTQKKIVSIINSYLKNI